MPIVQTVTLHHFRQAFVDAGRENQFSYRGLEMLYDYLDDLSDQAENPIELDVIALCCDYSEEHYLDIAENYGINLDDCEDCQDKFWKVLDFLERETCVIGDDEEVGFIVYQNY